MSSTLIGIATARSTARDVEACLAAQAIQMTGRNAHPVRRLGGLKGKNATIAQVTDGCMSETGCTDQDYWYDIPVSIGASSPCCCTRTLAER